MDRRILLFTFFLNSIFYLNGQVGVPRVLNFTQKETGTHAQNWNISQAPNGLIYVANTDGLLEYDGALWRKYQLPENQIVRSVACDDEGHVFVGGYGEFGFFKKGDNGVLTYHSLSKDLKFDKAHNEEIWHILVKDDFVLFQSFSVIYKYDYESIRIISPPGIVMFVRNVNDRLLMQILEDGIFELTKDDSFKPVGGAEILRNSTVNSILPLGTGGIFVGTINDGAFILENDKIRPWGNPLNEQLKSSQLNKALHLKDGSLVLGTILDGVFLVQPDGELDFHLNKALGLQNNTVLSIFQDDIGDLWLGLDKGLDLVVVSEPVDFFLDKSGRIGTVYTALVHENHLFLGTNHGVFYRSLNNGSPGNPDYFKFLEGTQGQVWELVLFQNQLICGHNDGTFLIKNFSIEKISDVTGGWKTRPVPGYENELLLQSTYTGFVLFRNEGGWKFWKKVEGVTDPVRQFVFDENRKIWAVNPYKGLYTVEIDFEKGNLISFENLKNDTNLPSEFRLELISWRDSILVKSNDQLYYPTSNGQFDEIFKDKVFPVEGLDGEWFEAGKGDLTWYRDGEAHFLNVTLHKDNICVLPIQDETYLLGLDDGYALLERNQPFKPLHNSNIKPMIREVRFLKKDYSVFTDENGGLLELEYEERDLAFYYSIPSYSKSAKFRYKLKGFQNEWSDWTFSTNKEYTNLPEGTYEFWVESEMSNQAAVLKLNILPPWYRSKLAIFGYGVLLIGILFGVSRFQRKKVESKLRRMRVENERLLHEQKIEAQNEKLQADVVNKSTELANSTMNLIKKNEILLEIKEEIDSMKEELGSRFTDKHYAHLMRMIDNNLSSEDDWNLFETNFNQVHERFLKNLKKDFPHLTSGDLRLAAYLRMNLTSKEIAPLLNISLRGVENKRYRLRQKLELDNDANLTDILLKY